MTSYRLYMTWPLLTCWLHLLLLSFISSFTVQPSPATVTFILFLKHFKQTSGPVPLPAKLYPKTFSWLYPFTSFRSLPNVPSSKRLPPTTFYKTEPYLCHFLSPYLVLLFFIEAIIIWYISIFFTVCHLLLEWKLCEVYGLCLVCLCYIPSTLHSVWHIVDFKINIHWTYSLKSHLPSHCVAGGNTVSMV